MSVKGTKVAKGQVKNYDGSDKAKKITLAPGKSIAEQVDAQLTPVGVGAAKPRTPVERKAKVEAPKAAIRAAEAAKTSAAVQPTPTVNVNLNPRNAVDGMRGRGVKVTLTDRGRWTVTDADAKAIAWAKAQTTAVYDLGASSFRIDLGLAQPEKVAPQTSKAGAAKKGK